MKTNVFQLIDFDRTLFDTTALIEAILTTIARTYPDVSSDLKRQSEDAYKEERTFMLLRYLREHYGDAWVEELIGRIVRERGASAFMLPGVYERLQAADDLSTARPSWGILTYGDVLDQLMKIRIAGLEDAPAHIVTIADKGNLIASWQLEDGRYRLPPEFGGAIVDALTFEDDKLRVFKGTPEDLIGVWVTHREDAKARLTETNLQNVTIARDLFESIEHIKARLKNT